MRRQGGGGIETQSDISYILKLLTPGRDSNPSGDIALVTAIPVGGADN